MPAWAIAEGGPLTADQILNVVAYLHTLQNVPVIPKPTPGPEEAVETPEPPGPTLEPARPSHEGNVGPAAALTGNANRGKPLFGQNCAPAMGRRACWSSESGSEDGSVPVLNPIDATIVSKDPKVFISNLDLFIEHGSVPAGDDPAMLMPSFGDATMLASQDIADIMAYIMQLNSGQ